MGGDQSKREISIEDILQSLKKSGIFDQHTCEVGRLIFKHLQLNQRQQIQIFFENRQQSIEQNVGSNSPVCQRSINKEETAYECLTCEYVSGRYFCQNCFQKQQHSMHDYHTIQGKKVVCDCGNDQLLNQDTFCKKHRPVITPPIPQDIEVKKEVKLFVWILLFLKENINNPKTLKISSEICELFGQLLLKYLLNLSKNKLSQTILAQALLGKIDDFKLSQVKLITAGTCLLEDLIYQLSQASSISGLLIDLINQLYWVGKINKKLLQIYYKVLLTGDHMVCLFTIFQRLKYDFLFCYKNQLQYFSDLSNCRIFLNRPINEPAQVEKQYMMLYTAISKVLLFKDSTKMITNMMRETPFSKFFNFQQDKLKFNEVTGRISISAFYLARRIIKVIEDKEILKSIVFNSLEAIKKKHLSFNLIFERSFALALYQYFDFRIPEASELKEFLSKSDPKPQDMILNFWQTKDVYFDRYLQSVIKNQKGDLCPSEALLATDHLYLKIIFNMITSKEEAISLYKRFISEKILHSEQPILGIEKIRQLLGKGNIHIIKRRVLQFNTFISTLSSSFNTNLPQLIIKACQSNDTQSVLNILNYLSIVFDGCSAGQFKHHAQRLVGEEQAVRFIKEKLIVEGKKVHPKGEVYNNVRLFPYSEYFPMKLSEMVMERMIGINFKEGKNKINIFTQEDSIKHLLVLLFAYISYIEENPECQSHIQQENKRLLRNILAFSGQQKGKQYLTLVHRIRKRLTSTSTVIQNFLKRIFQYADKTEASHNVINEKARTNKKRQQKLDQIKSKQKHALEAYPAQGQAQGGPQCIVCKNTKQQNKPFLLGYFGYKNIFSKILSTDTPFLEFSSCGHHIHDECLQQSHKGDFKIWYPCILCKSICNILLPCVDEENDGLFQSILTFLKNLGGIYTFFYQDRKELIEFSLQNVEGVFPLLFKTLVYQITFYPILNLQYFQRSQLPVTRFLFDLLRYTAQKLNGVAIVKKIQPIGDPLFVGIFSYIADRLAFLLRKQSPSLSGSELPSDIVSTIEEILYILDKNDKKMELSQKQTKEYRDKVVQIFLKPPKDLRELQSKKLECMSCQKIGGNCESCLLCEWSCCSKCSEVKKVHALQAHLSQSVFLCNLNGKYIYIHEELMGEFNSLYADYLGEEYNSIEKAGPGEYLLSKDKWESIVEDLLSNRIHRQIMKFQ